MAEYIKRIDVLNICRGYSEHCFHTNDSRGQDIADRIEDDIVELPTAGVVEVKYGEWLWDIEDIYECSNCHTETRVDEVIGMPIYKYCPFCGVEMDGGKVE